MTGEKRVVRVGIASIRVPLQAQLQGTTLLPKGIGKRLDKRPAKRWQGIGWERSQYARGADLGDQRYGRAPRCCASRPSAPRFGSYLLYVGDNTADPHYPIDLLV